MVADIFGDFEPPSEKFVATPLFIQVMRYKDWNDLK